MNTSAGVMGSGADLDPKLVARINMALAQTGERERYQYGWPLFIYSNFV